MLVEVCNVHIQTPPFLPLHLTFGHMNNDRSFARLIKSSNYDNQAVCKKGDHHKQKGKGGATDVAIHILLGKKATTSALDDGLAYI